MLSLIISKLSQPTLMSPTPSMLFIFDFDGTIISDNSDTFIPRALSATHALLALEDWDSRSSSWTQLMDHMLVLAQNEDGKTIQDVREAATRVPFFPELVMTLERVAEVGKVVIVSDANDVYIESFLDKHVKPGVVEEVFTNVTYLDDTGRLRLNAYSHKFGGHLCKQCPSNMCKTHIVRRVLEKQEHRPRIFYFGDGSNDYCPVLNVLEKDDVVFARDDVGARGLIKKIQANPVRPQVVRWVKGVDLLEAVRRLLA